MRSGRSRNSFALGFPLLGFSTPGASLIDLERIHFVIATDTDEEAETLRKDYPNLHSQLCEAMIRSAIPQPLSFYRGFVSNRSKP